jgi:NAD-dependent deacetylase
MERAGRLKTIITQNIDGLHQAAGSRAVVEFHGNIRGLTCLRCHHKLDYSPEAIAAEVPRCRCGGLLKPDFVFFQESIPAQAVNRAMREARRADVMMVIGTSAQVWPAAELPRLAKEQGAFLVEINTDDTRLTSVIADVTVKASATEALRMITAGL